jgi:hypothetical protein
MTDGLRIGFGMGNDLRRKNGWMGRKCLSCEE